MVNRVVKSSSSPSSLSLKLLHSQHACARGRVVPNSVHLSSVTLEPIRVISTQSAFNPLTPNDHYSGRTAPLTSKSCILYIYSTNIGTEHFNLLALELFF